MFINTIESFGGAMITTRTTLTKCDGDAGTTLTRTPSIVKGNKSLNLVWSK